MIGDENVAEETVAVFCVIGATLTVTGATVAFWVTGATVAFWATGATVAFWAGAATGAEATVAWTDLRGKVFSPFL